MQTPFAGNITEGTRRLVEPLIAADSVYRLVGNEIDEIIGDEDFPGMYSTEGRPAVNPVALALVSIFQFLEKLPDRVAGETVVMRMNWKYALRQELTWRGFHYSDLCSFRKRLLAHGREQVVFELSWPKTLIHQLNRESGPNSSSIVLAEKWHPLRDPLVSPNSPKGLSSWARAL
jgi:hypothetical protein